MSTEDKSQVCCQVWKMTDDIVLKTQKKLRKNGTDLNKSATIHKLIVEGAKKVAKQ